MIYDDVGGKRVEMEEEVYEKGQGSGMNGPLFR